MSEWWTYTLSDFLLFSSRTYYRLIELYNAAIWPAQLVALGLGLLVFALVLAPRASAARDRIVAAILGAAWLWVAIAFHAHRYATINWAAIYFAWAFGLEAAWLFTIGAIGGRIRFGAPKDFPGRAGLAIVFFAVALEPLAAPLFGRGWRRVELFGVTPDPTAVATLGILVAANGRLRWLGIGIPAVWCAISGATLLAMKSPDWWVAPLAAATSIALCFWRRPKRGGRT